MTDEKALDAVDEEQTQILRQGERVFIGGHSDDPEVLPNGLTRWSRQNVLATTIYGTRIQPGMQLFSCACCNRFPFAQAETRTCQSCERTICLDCVGNRMPGPEESSLYLCGPCARQSYINGLIAFFFSFR